MINKNDTDALRLAIKKTQQGRILSAEQICMDALFSANNDSVRKAYWTCHLGMFYWGETGYGEQAYDLFVEAIDLYDKHTEVKNQEAKLHIAADSFENLMHLSLSYDEFDKWVGRLSDLAPKSPILSELVPQVRKIQENGAPWYEVMLTIAYLYHVNKVHYASMVCILQRLLKNRAALRVPRDKWAVAANHCAAAAGILSDELWTRMANSGTPIEYDEFLFVAIDILPLLQEYSQANLSDEDIKNLISLLEKNIQKCMGQIEPARVNQRVITTDESSNLQFVGQNFLPKGMHWSFWLFLITGGALTIYALVVMPSPWNIIIGIAIGAAVAYAIFGHGR